jgi:hypothetical protein
MWTVDNPDRVVVRSGICLPAQAVWLCSETVYARFVFLGVCSSHCAQVRVPEIPAHQVVSKECSSD